MRIYMFGVALILAGCSGVLPGPSPKGVGFGNYATYQGNSIVPAQPAQVAQAPVAAPSKPKPRTSVAGGGLPIHRYAGRKNVSKLSPSAAAGLAASVASNFVKPGTYSTVLVAGYKLEGQQVYVGAQHFVVLRAGAASHRYYGTGKNTDKLKSMRSDVAKLTGCTANRGVFAEPLIFVVPISCL